MKKLLTIALALLVVFAVAGCAEETMDIGIDRDSFGNSENNKNRDEDDARKAAENFMEALCEFNFKDMSKYSTEDYTEIMECDDMYEYLDGTFSAEDLDLGIESDKVDDAVNDFVEVMVDGIVDNTEYEITDTEKDGDAWKFTVEITSVDMDDVSDSLESEECNDAVVKASEKYDDVDIEGMTGDEITAVMEDMVVDMFGAMGDFVYDYCEEAETVGGELELYVIEEDGEWLVDIENSDMSAFEKMFE